MILCFLLLQMWITNGTLTNDGDGSTGDCFLVYARTGQNKTDVTQFVVEKGFPGFSCGQKIADKVSGGKLYIDTTILFS